MHENAKSFWDKKKTDLVKGAVVVTVVVAAYHAGRASAIDKLFTTPIRVTIPDAMLSEAARRFM